MIPQRRIAVSLVASSLLILTSWLTAWSQEEPTGSSSAAVGKVAVVDITIVGEEYVALQEKNAELQAWLSRRAFYLESLEDYVFLSEDNFSEVLEILNMAPPVPDEEQARLEEIAALSEQKELRFAELEAKSPRTTAEAEEFSTLREVRDGRRRDLGELAMSIDEEYQQQLTLARRQLMRNVEQAVADYAQEQGYDLVLERAVVIYGGDDITRAIIARLNPPAQPVEETGEATGE